MKKKYSKKQKGGRPGVSGSAKTLVDNIFGLATSITRTMIDSAEFVISVATLPGDLGQPYKESRAPGIELI